MERLNRLVFEGTAKGSSGYAGIKGFWRRECVQESFLFCGWFVIGGMEREGRTMEQEVGM